MATLEARITELEQKMEVSQEPRYTLADMIKSIDDPDVLKLPPATPSRHGHTLLEWERIFSPFQGTNHANI